MNQQYFETIKCYDYEVFNLEYHIKRIADTIGMNINLEEYIYPINDKLLKCNVIYDISGILDIQYQEYIKKEIFSFAIIYDDDIIYNKKSIHRECLDKYKKELNSDEIIVVKNGLITDTSIANIAIYYDNNWITPTIPLLNGTTRNRYINNNLLITKDISVKMLKQTNKIALLNAMIDFDIKEDYIIKD